MTQTQAWSDSEITEAIRRHGKGTTMLTRQEAMALAQQIRDAMKAEIDRLTRQVESLTKELGEERRRYAECTTSLITADRQIARLKHQLYKWEDASPTDHDIYLIDELPNNFRLQKRREAHDATNAD